MQHPELAILIHRSKLVSSNRSAPVHTMPRLVTNPITTLRAVAGNALVTAGSRIAPESRPKGARAEVGGISVAGGTDI